MDRTFYYMAIAFFGMINGLFNQTLLLFSLIHMQILAPALLFGSVPLTLMFASLMVSTATIILGGIPAAIYERVTDAKDDFDRIFALDLARRNCGSDLAGDRKFLRNPALRQRVALADSTGTPAFDGAVRQFAARCTDRGSKRGGDMDHMRRVAFETVLRACGFASLAIFCVMIGLSFEPRAAFQAGGFLTTLMALILIFKAREALTKNYRKTEMWLYLPKELRPPESYAQWASATVLRETYLTFARWTAAIAIVMWVLALFCSLIGV